MLSPHSTTNSSANTSSGCFRPTAPRFWTWAAATDSPQIIWPARATTFTASTHRGGGNPGRFFVCDVTTGELLPELRKIPFRTVISMEVIEHLHSPRTFAAFVRSILEANGGGRFILTTPYHGYLKNLSIALAGKADRHYSALWEGGHIKFWSRRTLAILLREAGFRNMAFTGAGRIPYLWRHMVFSAETPAAAEVRACDPAAEP